jgi:hypothetical protein
MKGLFAGLTEEQKKAALEYEDCSIGPTASSHIPRGPSRRVEGSGRLVRGRWWQRLRRWAGSAWPVRRSHAPRAEWFHKQRVGANINTWGQDIAIYDDLDAPSTPQQKEALCHWYHSRFGETK